MMSRKRTDRGLLMVVVAMLVVVNEEAKAEECRAQCVAYNVVVQSLETEHYCSIMMPDNPYRSGDPYTGEIIPCQIEIHSNCSTFCQIELNFKKSDLPGCTHNLTNTTEHCDIIDSCEYIIVHEKGISFQGDELEHINHFHGYHTKQKFVSKSDKILLEFCYRSETFSGRNIQIKYRAIDPTYEPPVYYGPMSVYVLGVIVVLLAVAVALIRWCPCVKECFEPPEDNQNKQPQNV